MRRLAALALIIACLLFWGCNTQQRQVRKLDALAIVQPIEFARLSNLLNPCFTGKAKSDTISKTDTVVIAGATNTNTVYVKGNGDTIIKTVTTTLPGKLINHTITIHDTIADNRALTVARNDYGVKRDSLIAMRTNYGRTAKNLSIWRMIALCACGLIVIYGVLKAYVFFSGGAATSIIKKVV